MLSVKDILRTNRVLEYGADEAIAKRTAWSINDWVDGAFKTSKTTTNSDTDVILRGDYRAQADQKFVTLFYRRDDTFTLEVPVSLFDGRIQDEKCANESSTLELAAQLFSITAWPVGDGVFKTPRELGYGAPKVSFGPKDALVRLTFEPLPESGCDDQVGDTLPVGLASGVIA